MCRRAAGRGWQGPRALPGGPAAFSPLSLVQAGNMTMTGIGQGGSKHPRCPRQRRLVVSPIHARRGANKTAKLILTGDLNPILSQVPEATNQHTAFCTAVPLLLSRSKTHNPGLQRASPNYTLNAGRTPKPKQIKKEPVSVLSLALVIPCHFSLVCLKFSPQSAEIFKGFHSGISTWFSYTQC